MVHSHEPHGGIEPIVAIKAHHERMASLFNAGLSSKYSCDCQPGVVRQALDEAGITMNDIDGIAYTRGPGMALYKGLCALSDSLHVHVGMFGCLRTCSTAARTLASVHGKPIVGVHHMVFTHALHQWTPC
jgi:N6-L-threonylcarbamoyladenine synthase